MSERIALVTGATRGIGRAIALELAKQGATVIGTATSAEGAAAIDAYLAEAGAKGKGVQLNVTDDAQTDALLAQIAKDFGDITILVNNAGITRDQLLMRMKDDEWDAIMQTNLRPVFRISRALMRGMMKARWGRIINIASVVGASGSPGQTNYAAAKAGMMGFARSLAREVGSRNITVNCVAPGFITTAMTDKLNDEQKARILTQVPAGRMGEAGEIAAAVLYLASPEAGYVTGTTLHVNGGMAMI